MSEHHLVSDFSIWHQTDGWTDGRTHIWRTIAYFLWKCAKNLYLKTCMKKLVLKKICMKKLVWKNLYEKTCMKKTCMNLLGFLLFPDQPLGRFSPKTIQLYSGSIQIKQKNCKSFAAFVLEETWEITCFLVFLLSCLLTSIILRIPLQRLGRFSCCFQHKTQNFKQNFQTLKFFWIYSTAAPEIQKNCFFNQKKTERKQYIHCVNMINTYSS